MNSVTLEAHHRHPGQYRNRNTTTCPRLFKSGKHSLGPGASIPPADIVQEYKAIVRHNATVFTFLDGAGLCAHALST